MQRAEALLSDPTPKEWALLSRFDAVITREEFETRLNRVFDPWHGLAPWVEVTNQRVVVYATLDRHSLPAAVIRFARSPSSRAAPQEEFRSPEIFRSLPATANGKPLAGLRVAIEPADIGGRWAKTEDRSVYYPGFGLINEV